MGVTGKNFSAVTHGTIIFIQERKKSVCLCVCVCVFMPVAAVAFPGHNTDFAMFLQEQNEGIICCEMAPGLGEEHKDRAEMSKSCSRLAQEPKPGLPHPTLSSLKIA